MIVFWKVLRLFVSLIAVLNPPIGDFPHYAFLCVANLQNVKYAQNHGGMRWRSRLKHCATTQKVAGLIPDGVIGIILLAALWTWSRLSL